MPHIVEHVPVSTKLTGGFTDRHEPRAKAESKPVDAKNLPVAKAGKDLDGTDLVLRPHADIKQGQREVHLRKDIVDIGQELNNVNNDLYHVLNELLNNQSAEFEHTLYNLRARDYNASLPSRRRQLKPLRNTSTGVIHEMFYAQRVTKTDEITVEDLEELSNKDKELVLADLGMDQEFNYLHNSVPFLKNFKEPAVVTEEMDEGTTDALEEEEEYTGDGGIAVYFNGIAGKEKREEIKAEYSAFLTAQLRIAVGLPRNYCSHI